MADATQGSTATEQGPRPYHSGGLYDTLWPSDHQNTARSKFVTDGGLPADFQADSIEVLDNPELPYAQWAYTRGPADLYVYGVPSDLRSRAYFARVDPKTLAIRQKVELPQILYIGGALMHANGDVFLVHGPRLIRFTQGDLTHKEEVALPLTNGVLSQYNGMLVGDDGHLLLKGWALTHHDLPMVWRVVLLPLMAALAFNAVIWPLLFGLVGMSAAWTAAIGLVTPVVATLALLWRRQTSLREFFKPQRTGHLIAVDPVSLKVASRLEPSERLAFARMAMAPVRPRPDEPGADWAPETDLEGEWITIPGDEFIHRIRYHAGQLYPDGSGWTERYRAWGDGSFPGTGPSIWGRQVYYTDNTFPVNISAGYRMFRKPLDGPAPQQAVELSDGAPDFMFFSTVVAPSAGLVITWGTAGSFVEGRSLDDLAVQWRAELFNTDCLSVSDGAGLLYCVDHDTRLTAKQMLQSASRRPRWPDTRKAFVVLDVATGKERLRLDLGQGSPVALMIVPGYHGSVYVATRAGLNRVYDGRGDER